MYSLGSRGDDNDNQNRKQETPIMPTERDETIGSYEQGCIDYAASGCPMRDHYGYETNAEYDRYDGLRGDALDADVEAFYDDMSCDDDGDNFDVRDEPAIELYVDPDGYSEVPF